VSGSTHSQVVMELLPMKKILVLLALVFCAIPCLAQQYPPYIFLDANLNPYPSGSGSALGSNPPYALCYTNVTGQPLPCNFSGSGPSFTYPSGTGIVTVTGGAAWGTTLAAPAGTIVGTTDTQTLTNKTVDGVTPTVFGFVDPTSSIQTQLNSKGSGTVTSVSVTTANGVSGTVATATTTPAITLTLGAITPTSTNGVSAATMAFMDATSSVQTQLNSKQASGTYVTGVSVASANGVSGTSSGGATPALTLSLGAITPTSIAPTGSITLANGQQYGGTTTTPNVCSIMNLYSDNKTYIGPTSGCTGAAGIVLRSGDNTADITGLTSWTGAAATTMTFGNNFQLKAKTTTAVSGAILSLFTDNNLYIGFSTMVGHPIIATGDGTYSFTGTGLTNFAGPVSATAGYQIGGAATSGNYLRGNGTNFVSSAIQTADLPTGVQISIPTGTATFATGSNITSVACASGYLCNNTRGTLTIVAAVGASTGTIATVNFSATLAAAPACFAYENGGSTNFGIGNSAPTTAGFNITAAVTVSLATLTVNYTCQP